MNAGSGHCQQIWLVVAQGGWWKTKEVYAHVGLDIDPDDFSNFMWVMSRRRGYLSTRGRGRDREYAVTSECIAPYGLTVRQITGAIVGERSAA